ncbi:MAG TPA: tetratricopeptide repeat protein, partial [Gemmatimonadales bacterium]|nr:tetratricopeptide repeat protein [Gemmatimonadales bacterium]
APPVDDDLLAIAPFEILVPELDYWREGLVDVLAANLDGAGPIRTVPATIAVRRFEGRADRASAVELGLRTGARMVLVGRVVGRGGDSVALVASLLDTEGPATLAEFEVTDPEARLDRLADNVTVRLLNELSRTRAIGAVRRAMFGTASLPALKAYLIGEQHYRRSEWDSAIASYQRAISLDSTFALPHYRAGIVLGWQTGSGDSLSQVYLQRAAANNRGLPPRDSLLVLAESLGTVLDGGYVANPRYWYHLRRLYGVVREATRRFPRDPEVWYEYGDVHYHYPEFATRRGILDAFDRALRLDSAYAPAYIHAIELALQLGELDRARRYIRSYLALNPRDIYADGIRLTEMLLNPRLRHSAEVQRILDTASADLLTAALANFRSWPDSSETSIRLARLLAEGRPSGAALYSDSSFYIPELAVNLAYHGRMAEAYALVGTQFSWLYAIMAHLGGVPAESARARFDASLRNRPLWPPSLAGYGLTIWANLRDSVALASLARAAETAPRQDHPLAGPYTQYLADAARALIRLIRGDTAGAARELLALPDTACRRCVLVQLMRAQVLEAARMDDEAARLLARDPPDFQAPFEPLWMLYRARVLRRRGELERAAVAYRHVRDAWLHADPVLQPYVREAREALGQLGVR